MGEAYAVRGRGVGGDHNQAVADLGEPLVDGAELVDVHGLGDDNLRARGLELLVDLRRRAEGVGGGGHRPEHGSAHEGEYEFRSVLEEDHDDIPLPDPELGQSGGGPAAQEVGLREGVDLPGGGGDDAGGFGQLGQLLEAVGVEREMVRDGDIRELRPEDDRLRRLGFRRTARSGDLGLGLMGSNGDHDCLDGRRPLVVLLLFCTKKRKKL